MHQGSDVHGENRVSAARALLGELIDDAGLFPPARLSMRDALAAHERAEASHAYWMLGRFIVPVSRLEELRAHLDDAPEPLATSVILDGDDPSADLATVAREVERDDRVAVEALEIRAAILGSASDATAFTAFGQACTRAGLPPAIVRYVEIPKEDDPASAVAALRSSRDAGHVLCAKVRCGGLTADAMPPASWLADFIIAARTSEVPFKATAGLHHPVWHVDVAAGCPMYGFLNVIGGAVLAYAGALDRSALEAMLVDDEPGRFRLDVETFAWNGIAVDAAAIGSARGAFVHSYGSCSFDEPVDELCALGMLSPDRL